MAGKGAGIASWTTAAPVLALVVLALTLGRDLPAAVIAVVALLLGAAVLSAVHHAEVVAHRVGEPFGSLVLAVAVTVIEVGLIIALMSSGGPGAQTLARDTVFSAVMITVNGIMGLSLLVGAVRHHLVYFNPEGTGSALATALTLATLGLVMPAVTTSAPGPRYTPSQLGFAAVSCLVIYGLFVATQTHRHRDFFLPVTPEGDLAEEDHAHPPTTREAGISLGLLLLALVAVVGLAKVVSPTIEAGVKSAGLPPSFVGVVIALLVLAPETLAAVRAARRARLQTSLNLALGSAIASIGLTIPAIAITTAALSQPLVLGLDATQLALLGITAVVATLTVVPGRSTRLQGGIHVVLFAAFVFLAAVP